MVDADASDAGEAAETAEAAGPAGAAEAADVAANEAGDRSDEDDLEALRRAVEEKYDFDNFGPDDMAEMTVEEWEAAFDPDSWVVGPALLDRVEDDLKNAIARRDVFAKLERYTEDGEPRLAAYSDEGYAVVYPDGSVEGSGTVLRDVKPTVALCSMEDYEVAPPPEDFELPSPTDVPEGSGEFGNLMLQVVAAGQLLVGLGLFVAWAAGAVSTIVAPALALGFVLVGVFLFVVVANARLSDRFRAEEYRNRLRAVGTEEGERPAFLPPVDGDDEVDDIDDETGPDAGEGGDGETGPDAGEGGDEPPEAAGSRGVAAGDGGEPETADSGGDDDRLTGT
jgi:hypothetical protein